jgi:hypothetical protein
VQQPEAAMKNPRVTLTSGELKYSKASAFPVAENKGSTLDDVLKFLKFSDSDIKTIDAIKDTVTTLASTLNWALAAVNTIKGVLTLLGVFEPAKDNTLAALQAIGQRLEQIYVYLEQTEKTNEYRQASTWRGVLGGLRNAVTNLGTSRSALNLSQVRQKTADLQQSLMQMLAIPFGTIPFQRAAYHYTPATIGEVPPHWIDYAVPFFMTQYDGKSVNYGDPNQELQAQIWDPGYYLDVLVQSLELRILALSATEPAFRSTALDREDLRALYRELGTFIDTWQKSMLITRVVGPIDPGLAVGGPAGTGHPLHGVNGDQTSIPVGVIDPVSGISSLEPQFNTGFDLFYYNWPGANPPYGYWLLTNYDAAIGSASNEEYQLRTRVLARCGITTLQAIRDAIGDMIVGPMGSEFVDFSPVSFSVGTVQKGATENVSLGLIGEYSAHPNKTYAGTRYVEYNTAKSFRIPMARRTDVSQIQLGYALEIALDDGAPPVKIVLCPYDAATPNAPVFPSEPITQTLQSDNATVYDVYQSTVFSVEQEEEWENDGTIQPWTYEWKDKFAPSVPPQRLFVHPRNGKVRAQVSITFDPGDLTADSPFIGYANVSVKNLSPDHYRDGFMISISAYETSIGTTGVASPDVQMTKLADSVTLHFVPSFLVLGSDYFSDRAQGLRQMAKMFSEINQRYVRYASPGPIPDPMSKVENGVRQERMLVAVFETLQQMDPEAEASLRARVQPPVVRGEIDAVTRAPIA